MDLITISLILLLVLFFLLAGGVWIAVALLVTGLAGMWFAGAPRTGDLLATTIWGESSSYTLAALPMFIWMGEILFRTRLSEEMFRGLAPWLNRIPGRLLHVNVLASGLFGSVSGSSAATCATIAKVALPELQRRGYDEKLALGALATAGTLGILIPPSITMVVYAVAAEASIIRIFLAGFIPGFLLMALFSGYIAWWSWRHPERTPPPEAPTTFREKLRLSGQLIPCALLILFIVVVLVLGWATATECAAYGVLGSLVLAWWGGSLDRRSFIDSLMGATRVSCMIMFILAGAKFLSMTMGYTGIPRELAEWVASLNLSPLALISVLSVVYIVLGTALDGISMIVLTAAVVLPMVQKAGFDLIWFGIFVVLLVEIAEVTPPVGFNLFVLQNMTGHDSNYIAKVSLPFFFLLVACIGIISAFPSIVTWLPDLVMGVDK